jgi:cyclohexanone monooxygenase
MTVTDGPTTPAGTTIDKEALRRKYLEERDKRLRPDGNDQYVQLTGQLAHHLADPYTPAEPRAPRRDHVTVAFVGGGFAGLVTGARLKEAGVDSVRIIEKGGDFGGTWYWNRYPGAQCDTRRSSTCRCSRRRATCRPRSTRTSRRSSSTARGSVSTSASTTTRCSTPR